jgi:hypothetical protein
MLTSTYDLIIFIPLWIESLVKQQKTKEKPFNPTQTQTLKEA